VGCRKRLTATFTGGRAGRRGAVQVTTNRANGKMDLTCETGVSQVTPASTQPPFLASQKTQPHRRKRRPGSLSGTLESVREERSARSKGPSLSLALLPSVSPAGVHLAGSPRGGRATVARDVFHLAPGKVCFSERPSARRDTSIGD